MLYDQTLKMFQVLVSCCLFLSVSMSVTLLLCVVSIFRLLAWIAVNLFKKKQFQIKMVNIVCVVFRLVKKKLLRVFILWLHNKLKSALIQQSVVLHFAVLGTRHSALGTRTTNQGKRAVFLTNQKRNKNQSYARFPALGSS